MESWKRTSLVTDWRIRRKDVKGHRRAMLGVYFGGLIIAGALTFYPGRLMYRLFFG